MSRSKRFVSGVILGYAYNALVMVVGLWLTPFLLKRIGQHDFGLWLVGTQVLSYLMMLDFGIVGLLPRETAYAMGRAGGRLEQATDLARITGETACVVLYQMPVVILAVGLIWFFMPQSWLGFRGPITVALAAFAIMFPLRIFQAILEGLQDLKFLGRLQICNWVISTSLMILLILCGFRLYALAIGWSAGQLLAAGVVIYRVKSTFPSALPNRIPGLTLRGLYDRFVRGFWVIVSQISMPMVYQSDLLIVGKMYGASMVVPYSCTTKIINVLYNQPSLLMQAAMPGLSELRAGESRQRLFQATTALTLALLMASGGVACVALIVNRGFVDWWVGPRQYAGSLLTALLVVVMLLRHWNTTAVYATFCFGYERRISIATLLDGIVTIGASVLLVHWFGLIGAPLGAMVGVCTVSLPLNLTALARELGKNLGAVLRPLWSWFWRFVILAGLAAWAGRFCGTLNFVQLAAVSASTALIYAMVMYFPVRRSALGPYLQQRLAPLLATVWRPNRSQTMSEPDVEHEVKAASKSELLQS